MPSKPDAEHDPEHNQGRLLLLIPKTSYRAQDFLAAAEQLGADVAVGSNHRSTLEKLTDGKTVKFNFKTVERGVEEIIAYNDKHPLKAVLSVDEETTVLAAEACKALGLPHNPPDAIRATVDKFKFRQAIIEAGLPSPEVTRLTIYDDPIVPARKVDYPVVLKPAALSASRGVIRADYEGEFIAAFERIVKILHRADLVFTGEGKDQILVETFVPGMEVALEGLLQDGDLTRLALFDKPDPLNGPFFEETLYITPSRLPEKTQNLITETTANALSVLGLTDGPVHAELRVNSLGVYVIEVGARTIGGLCARTLQFGTGMSLEEIVLRHTLGLSLPSTEREVTASGVMMIPIPEAGVLKSVSGEEDARTVPGIEDVTISISIGKELIPLPEGNKYLGFIFAKAETPESVEAALREAHRRLLFEITT
jgi:biotin carboxylase